MSCLRSTLRWDGPWYRMLAILVVAIAFTGCQDEERAARERIAGDYVIEHLAPHFSVRYVLTLRRDGTWTRIRLAAPSTRPIEPDSGTYRVVGVTINLRSLAYGGVPTRYTVVGDTLFGANAADMQRFAGFDIGEERFVRKR